MMQLLIKLTDLLTAPALTRIDIHFTQSTKQQLILLISYINTFSEMNIHNSIYVHILIKYIHWRPSLVGSRHRGLAKH